MTSEYYNWSFVWHAVLLSLLGHRPDPAVDLKASCVSGNGAFGRCPVGQCCISHTQAKVLSLNEWFLRISECMSAAFILDAGVWTIQMNIKYGIDWGQSHFTRDDCCCNVRAAVVISSVVGDSSLHLRVVSAVGRLLGALSAVQDY